MEQIIILIRALVQDLETKGVEPDTYDNETTFTISETNIISDSVKVYVNSSIITGFTVDYDTNKVTITDSLTPGDSIEIHYSYYPQYSDTEIKKYIHGSLAYLSVNQVLDEHIKIRTIQGVDELYPNPALIERRLIGIIAAILIEGNLRSYRTPDFSFTFQTAKTKEEKIQDVIRRYKSRAGVFDTIVADTE